jgi:hypothetical protein
MKILLVHGVGYQEDKNFAADWQPVIDERLAQPSVTFTALKYDDLFKRRSINWFKLGATARGLLKSWMEHDRDDRQRALAERGLLTPAESTIGMAVKWAEFDDLRATLRSRLKQQIVNDQADVIIAHSLGTLICYDLFARPENADLTAGITWLTIGSQIAHPALRNLFQGYLASPPKLAHWYAQFNPHDRVFAWEPVDLVADNFTRIDAPFREAVINHDALFYLRAEENEPAWRAMASRVHTSLGAVRELAGSIRYAANPGVGARGKSKAKPAKRAANRRALIVGIDQYAVSSLKLEGCVNDAYLMSALLQEHGFEAGEIRMVVNERATAAGIQERIRWLLADTGPGDVRILYYSGHGVQMPAYGASGEPDHLLEALVPHDFDWTEERSVSDKWLAKQYGNLPYDAHFAAMFDCCHSGGLSRSTALKVRSVAPPDDIAHRQLKWDWQWQMWVPRDFVKPQVARMSSVDPRSPTLRLGRGISLRPEQTRGLGKAFGHKGPYMPAILMACRADELAHEYRHGGGHAYGAFTYALSQVLRDESGGAVSTMKDLCDRINKRLPALGYAQHCAIDGPGAQLDVVGSWLRPRQKPRSRARSRK